MEKPIYILFIISSAYLFSQETPSLFKKKKEDPRANVCRKLKLIFNNEELSTDITSGEICDNLNSAPVRLYNSIPINDEFISFLADSYKKTINQKKMLVVIKSRYNLNEEEVFKNKIKAKSELLSDLIVVNEEEVGESLEHLKSNTDTNLFSGLYVIVNKDTQADEILNSTLINTKDSMTSYQSFKLAASEYALPKQLSRSGQFKSQRDILRMFNQNALTVLLKTKYGSCTDKIELDDGRFLLIFLDEVKKTEITQEYAKNHSILKKIKSMVDEKKNLMVKNGELNLILNGNKILDLKGDQVIAEIRIGTKAVKITSKDLADSLDENVQDKQLKEAIITNPRRYSKYVDLLIEDAVSMYIRAAIADEYSLPEDNADRYSYTLSNIENSLLQNLFIQSAKKSITEKKIMDEYKNYVQKLSKNKFKGYVLAVESSSIAQRIIKNLFNSKSLKTTFEEQGKNYSILSKNTFDMRSYELKKQFNAPIKSDFTDENSIEIESLAINKVYVSDNENTFYIFFVEEIYEKDVTLDEVRNEIINKLLKSEIKDTLSKVEVKVIDQPKVIYETSENTQDISNKGAN